MAEAAALEYEPFPLYAVDSAEVFELPPIISIAEQPADELTRCRALKFMSAVALEHTVEFGAGQPDRYTLMDALQGAYEGDEEARAMVFNNVRTDRSERTQKSGNIIEVALNVGENLMPIQAGQNLQDVHANSLVFAADSWQMRARTEAETRNAFRLQSAIVEGKLDEYAFAVISRGADDMAEADMEEAGFFTQTMSVSIQLTTFENGQLTMQSAFVAGKETEMSERHDAETITKMMEHFGLDYSGKTATETLDSPVLIHKSLIPNGVEGLVELYDDCAGGTFFGEAKPREDYAAYHEFCREREASFEPVVVAIAEELIAEAPLITSPRQATERLNKLSGKHMVERAVVDNTIDARVFGPEAAFRIEHARYLYDMNDIARAQAVTQSAVRVERSASCPSGASKTAETKPGPDNQKNTDLKSEKIEDCDFVSKKCPVCGEKNAKTRVRNGVYYHVGKLCKG